MESLNERVAASRRAVKTLREVLGGPYSVVARDASIQRFEYSFESLWKAIKAYLAEMEAVVCHSPKSCFRSALQAGLVTAADTRTALKMSDDRNLTSHTYIEAVAEDIYRKLPEYLGLMERVLDSMEARLAGGDS